MKVKLFEIAADKYIAVAKIKLKKEIFLTNISFPLYISISLDNPVTETIVIKKDKINKFIESDSISQ